MYKRNCCERKRGKVRCVPIILGRVVTEIALLGTFSSMRLYVAHSFRFIEILSSLRLCTWLMELLRAWMDKYARNLAFFAVNLAFAGHFHDFLREAGDLEPRCLRSVERRRS